MGRRHLSCAFSLSIKRIINTGKTEDSARANSRRDGIGKTSAPSKHLRTRKSDRESGLRVFMQADGKPQFAVATGRTRESA